MKNGAMKRRGVSLIKVLSAASVVTLCACASTPNIEDQPASALINPISKPDWSVGMRHEMVNIKNGQPTGYVISELLPDGKLRGTSLDSSTEKPCTWTASTEWFAPANSWENCGGSGEWISGTQSVKQVSGGSLWPLTVGANAKYRRTPVSSLGKRGTPETRSCEVVGPVAVSISLGDFDAMKIQCNTRRWDGAIESRIWYWTEEHGEIKFVQIHSREGIKQELELATIAD